MTLGERRAAAHLPLVHIDRAIRARCRLASVLMSSGQSNSFVFNRFTICLISLKSG
jgi:hypothetical protein